MTSIHWKHLGLALALTAGLLGTAGATADSAAATASRSGAVVAPLQSGSCSGNLPLGTVVGMAATSDDGGYWIADASGDVVSCGDATNFGSLPVAPVRPIVGITATAAGGGFWLVASDGGIFAFGDAAFHGSTGALRLNRPVVGMAQDAATGGYWLVASDGGIFAFDAPFLGSTGAFSLNRPIVGMALSGGGSGYWLVASDGGIFAFDAPFLGSMGAVPLNEPVVGMAAGTSTGGYWLVAADGGIFAFGAPFLGSTGSITLSRPIVGMESSPSGAYRFVASDGGIFAFGDNFYGSAVAPPPPPAAVAGAGLRVGPGVQSTYTVQPQAAPGTCHYRYQGTYPLPDPGCTPRVDQPPGDTVQHRVDHLLERLHLDHPTVVQHHRPREDRIKSRLLLQRVVLHGRVRPPGPPRTRWRPQRPGQLVGGAQRQPGGHVLQQLEGQAGERT